jgi:hypothetical protein
MGIPLRTLIRNKPSGAVRMIKTVKQACVFNPVIRDYRMAEGIENLADLIGDNGDGREFFCTKFYHSRHGAAFQGRYAASFGKIRSGGF